LSDENRKLAKTFEELWKSARLDERHRDHFDPDGTLYPGPWSQVQAQIAQVTDGTIVVLLGGRGRGKTQIAVNLIGRSQMALRYARYTLASELFRAVRDTQRKHNGEDRSEQEVINSYSCPKLLAIDQAHIRGQSDFENRTITEILDVRYAYKRTTILISNEDVSKFEEAIGPDITDRIREHGKVFVCDWPSFRDAAAIDVKSKYIGSEAFYAAMAAREKAMREPEERLVAAILAEQATERAAKSAT